MDMVRIGVAFCLALCLPHGWYSITNILMLNDMHHCCAVSYWRTLYILVLMKLSISKKLVENLDKMTLANLGRQHQRSLDSYFKSSWEYLYLFGVISYYFTPSIFLKLVVHIFKLTLLMFSYSLHKTTTLRHLSCPWEDDASIIRLFCVSQTCHTKEGEQCQLSNRIVSNIWF
jgi:hypothetical protein